MVRCHVRAKVEVTRDVHFCPQLCAPTAKLDTRVQIIQDDLDHASLPRYIPVGDNRLRGKWKRRTPSSPYEGATLLSLSLRTQSYAMLGMAVDQVSRQGSETVPRRESGGGVEPPPVEMFVNMRHVY